MGRGSASGLVSTGPGSRTLDMPGLENGDGRPCMERFHKPDEIRNDRGKNVKFCFGNLKCLALFASHFFTVSILILDRS